ncbi:Golgi transport complex subunit 3, partial [Coemansia thaxteri]
EISGQLAVYNSLGPITQLVHAPGDRVCLDREFLPSLERAETAIQYIEAHPEGKDSELYLMRFSQCRMRALTLIKIHALRVFRTLASDAASSVAALAPSSRAAELYVQFRASAVSLGPLLRALQQRAEPSESTAGSTEGQVLLDVQHAYFQTRRTWLQPYIQESLKAISREHKEAASAEVHVGLLQDWCAFMMNVCVDEYRLYHDFFETSGDQSSGAPAPPELRAYLDSAMTIFHEQVRPLIIHESDVAVLAGLSMTLLTYHRAPASEAAHMSTELDGSLQNSRTSAESDAGLEEDNEEDGLDAFYASVDQVLQDAQHRLAFRAQAYIRSHIGGYKISMSDADAMSRWVQLCLRLHVTDPSQLVDLVAQASVTIELQ